MGRIIGRLFLLLGALLSCCSRSQAATVPTIGPIPNQVAYLGGPALVVPLQLGVSPAGGQFNVFVYNLGPRLLGQFQVLGSGTNRYLFLSAIPATAKDLFPPGNRTLNVTVFAAGATNQATFLLTLLPGEFITQTYGPSFSLTQPLWADFNGDGFLDLAGYSSVGPSYGLGMQFNNSTGRNLTPVSFPDAAGKASGIVPADFDGDGDLDGLLLGSSVSQPVLVSTIQLSGESLVPRFANNPVTGGITNIVGAAWIDFDGDGDLDAIVTGTDAGRRAQPSRLLRNEGGGVMTRLDAALPAAAGPVVVADFDGDGTDDLLLTNTGERGDTPLLLHNNGEGGFSDTGAVFPHGPVAAAGWSDFNGDGLPDLWLQFKAGPRDEPPVYTNLLVLLQQRPDGGFTEIFRLGTEVMGRAGAPAWGDFDNDGTSDFIAPVNRTVFRADDSGHVVPTTNSTFTIYHNDGTGHFTPRGFLAGNTANAFPAAGDVDGDGALDLTMPATLSQSVVYNPNRPANLPPEAPGGLQAFAEGRNLFFFWNESTDPNQTAPLTYNLRVGTRPGANDIVASMSLGRGTRQLVAPGNCGFNTFRALRLPLAAPAVDVLYWSVQAVDNSFVGSTFAPEQELALDVPGNRPPVITGLTDLVIPPTDVQVVRFTITDDHTRLENLILSVTVTNPEIFRSGFPLLSRTQTSKTNPPLELLTLLPMRDVVGESDISVTAVDRQGLATTATFHVTVEVPQGSTSQPSLQLAAPVGDGALRFRLRDAAMTGLGLEQSEDLLHWTPVTGLRLDTSGQPAFSLPQPDGKDQFYYRLRTGE